MTNATFIEANTNQIELSEIRDSHIIPVFARDNEPAISHSNFIESIEEAGREILGSKELLKTSVTVSHPVRGRTPDARHKKANELLPHERTLYYERMAFKMETGIRKEVQGKEVSLSIVGVKAYNKDNLYRTHTKQKFQIAIGFNVFVCSNQVIQGDAILNLRAISEEEILDAAKLLFSNFKVEENIDLLSQFGNTRLSEQQFCNLLGRGRMYAALPKAEQKQISEIPLLLSDTQMGSVAKEYHRNKHFHKSDDGSIDLWRFHNLLTEANKSSYIDTFIERAANATDFTKEIAKGIESASSNSGWFLN